MKSLLSSTSYVFKAATTGTEALNFMRENELPALVLMEVAMPGLSGISVLKSLRNSYSPEILPVIIVSARTNKEIIIDCLKAGANDFVHKPFEQAELLWRIKLQLRVSKASRYPKGSEQSGIPKILRDAMPEDLFLSLQTLSDPSSPEPMREAAKARLQRLLQTDSESALAQAESTIALLKQQCLTAEGSVEKLEHRLAEKESKPQTGKYDLSLRSVKHRMKMLENQVRERENSLKRLKTLQHAQALRAEFWQVL
eukprot:Skav219799  [mRNA]  locus=scaffold147:150606:151370:- [translate_table: standard]